MIGTACPSAPIIQSPNYYQDVPAMVLCAPNLKATTLCFQPVGCLGIRSAKSLRVPRTFAVRQIQPPRANLAWIAQGCNTRLPFLDALVSNSDKTSVCRIKKIG